MTFDPIYVTYGSLALVIIFLIWIVRLEIKMRRFLKGKDGKTLEDSIIEGHKNIEKLNQFQKEAIDHFINVEKRLKRSVQAVNTIRFNPFKGVGEGGNQSFSTSFISENGDGVVISSLYSRDRISIYGKPLEKFESSFELTDEEREAVKKSKDLLK